MFRRRTSSDCLEQVERDRFTSLRSKGALLVVVFTEAVALGLIEPPREADIVVGELQSFAISPSYGGPYAGIIATREKYMRQIPGRLVGETTDADGRRAFCLTLATREQHIRREKATSNICTNQALLALMATVFMTRLRQRRACANWPNRIWRKRIIWRASCRCIRRAILQ